MDKTKKERTKRKRKFPDNYMDALMGVCSTCRKQYDTLYYYCGAFICWDCFKEADTGVKG